MLGRFHWLILALGLISLSAKAEVIQWFSDAGQVNLDSQNSAMDASYTFELGVFQNGFVPSSQNVSQWAANWVAADSTIFNGTTQRFTDQFVVVNNSTPFIVGAEAWIFGYRITPTGTERILFRDVSWTWPAPNPMNPIATEWNAMDASEVVVGSINSNGSLFLMKSSRQQTFTQWQTEYLTSEPLNTANDDPDNDGISNLLEFVFGTLPKTPNAPTVTPLILAGGNMQISIPRRMDRLVNSLIVEVSGNLTHWDSGSSYTQVVADDAAALIVRDLTTLDATHPRRFMRVRASLPSP